jgi:hypothetical protein
MTGYLPTHNDILDGMGLHGAETAERVANLSQSSGIAKSMEEFRVQLMEMPDAIRSEFIRDLMNIPITDFYFETVQYMLAV